MLMEEPVDDDDLEPLFDYSRVQPPEVFSVDDDDDRGSNLIPIFCGGKRKRSCDSKEEEGEGEGKDRADVVVVGADVRVDSKEKDEDDWLLPPPKIASSGTGLIDDKTLQELRLKKQELASVANSAEDVLKAVIETAKREMRCPEKSVDELEANKPSKPQAGRQKIVISIQDKDGQKQFRIYMVKIYRK